MSHDDEDFVTRQEIDEEATEEAKNTMREWFFQHFEDPAESTPYESREGGYQWIWGGPYNALEELQSAFAGEYPDEIIEELAEELTSDCWEWAPVQSEDYDDYYLDTDELLRNKAEHKFTTHMDDVIRLANVSPPPLLSNKYRQLLYANVIAAMEAYLTERFMQVVLTDDARLRIFVASTPEFREKKIPLATVFNVYDTIQDEAKTHLLGMIWHNITKVENMFVATLNFGFPKELKGPLILAVHNRHDIVHRNGFTKDGAEVEVTADSLFELIANASHLVAHIEAHLNPKPEWNFPAPPLGPLPQEDPLF